MQWELEFDRMRLANAQTFSTRSRETGRRRRQLSWRLPQRGWLPQGYRGFSEICLKNHFNDRWKPATRRRLEAPLGSRSSWGIAFIDEAWTAATIRSHSSLPSLEMVNRGHTEGWLDFEQPWQKRPIKDRGDMMICSASRSLAGMSMEMRSRQAPLGDDRE